MRELRRSFGVLGEAQWFWGLGGGRGGEAGSKKRLPPLEQRPPQYYRGAVPRRAILLVAASCKKMEHSNLGLRRDGASINEGKDPERALVTWNNPPTKDWDDLVAMLNPAYMVGQLERGGRQGRSIGSSLSSGRTLGPLPQSRTCPSLTLRRSGAGPPQ